MSRKLWEVNGLAGPRLTPQRREEFGREEEAIHPVPPGGWGGLPPSWRCFAPRPQTFGDGKLGRPAYLEGSMEAEARMQWPAWWGWDLEFTPHLEKRMEDRNFTEADLRRMLEDADSYRSDLVVDRWVIETRHRGGPWEVIVEPEPVDEKVVVVTAYPVEG